MRTVENFEEYQQLLKALLYFFDTFCRNNNIRYSVIDGTLLGAVRNQDIIPWDGDIDVAMTRKDFQKLVSAFECYKGRFYLNYDEHLWKNGTRKDHGDIRARLVDKKSSRSDFGIDISMIDFLGDDYSFAQETIKQYKKYYKNSKASISFHLPPLKGKSGMNYLRNLGIHLFYPLLFCASWVYKPVFLSKYNRFVKERLSFDESSKFYTIEPFFGRFNVSENNGVGKEYLDLRFGNFNVMAMKPYIDYLNTVYGDYMTLPPVEKRKPYVPEETLLSNQFEFDDEMNLLIDAIK